jgi:hypothetical protein
MIQFDQYYNEDSNEEKPWKTIPNREGLYVLANPFALSNELFNELQQNLEPTADHTYKSPNGFTYKTKIRNDGQLSIIGWKQKPQGQQGGYQKGSYTKSYGQKPSDSSEAKQFVDVEVAHTENISTVNEILSNGYMKGEYWRVHGIVNMPELLADGKVQVVPHFVLVRKKEFVPVAKPITSQPSQSSSGMPE